MASWGGTLELGNTCLSAFCFLVEYHRNREEERKTKNQKKNVSLNCFLRMLVDVQPCGKSLQLKLGDISEGVSLTANAEYRFSLAPLPDI